MFKRIATVVSGVRISRHGDDQASTDGIVLQVACRVDLTWARKSRQKTCNCERLFVRDGGISPLSVFYTYSLTGGTEGIVEGEHPV